LLGRAQSGIALALVCAGSMWFYVDHILVPYQRAEAVAHNRPRGNLSDLYPRWFGARELLLHHRNPYSPEITREIQVGYYGRVLDPRRPGDPRDQQGFAYPVYVAFLLAPTVGFSFATLAVGFKWLLICIAALTAVLWVKALGWKPGASSLFAMIVLTLGSFPVEQALHLQQLTLVVGALLAAACTLLVEGQLFWAGVALAMATIKPQLVLPLALYLALWAASDWKRRAPFLVGFGGTLAVLVAGSELLLPGWIAKFLAATEDYRRYTGGMSLMSVLLSPRLGGYAAALVLAFLIAASWRFRNEEPGTSKFSLMLALALAVTVVVIPMYALYNTFLLLPGVLLIARNARSLWASGRPSRVALMLSGIALAWPWAAALGMLLASAILSPTAVQEGWWLPVSSSLEFPIPLVCLAPLIFMVIRNWGERRGGVPARESSLA
jgi:hypothetical protein